MEKSCSPPCRVFFFLGKKLLTVVSGVFFLGKNLLTVVSGLFFLGKKLLIAVPGLSSAR